LIFGTNKLLDELREKNKELHILKTFNRLKEENEATKELAKAIAMEAEHFLEAEKCFVFLNNGTKLQIETDSKNIPIKIMKQLAQDAIKNSQPVMYNKVLNDELLKNSVKSILSVPIKKDGQIVGALQLFNKKTLTGFTIEDLRIAQIIASQTASAINFVKKIEELKKGKTVVQKKIKTQENQRFSGPKNPADYLGNKKKK